MPQKTLPKSRSHPTIEAFVALCDEIRVLRSRHPIHWQELAEVTVQAVALRDRVPRRLWGLLRR